MPRTKKTESAASEAVKPSRRGRPSTKKTETKVSKTKTTSRFDFQKQFAAIKNTILTNRQKYSKYLIVLGIVILIGLFAFWKKDWFVVAVVNREPVTSVEFYNNLKTKHGQEVLEQIVRDKIILQEAREQNVRVTVEEVDAQYREFEEQYGGAEALRSILEQNNISETDLRHQIQMELIVKKLLADEIQVSEEEIDQFIKDNPDNVNVAGTDEAKGPNRAAIRESLEQNKLAQKSQSWYQELENRANVLKFI